jgi:hypothetical protein
MALLRFFRVPKHQQYDYKPRFWDPKKEELQERLDRIEKIQGGDPMRLRPASPVAFAEASNSLIQPGVARCCGLTLSCWVS